MTGRLIDCSDRARVRLTGKDARSFLHRMSTQHVKDLRPGEMRLNTLVTDKGRIVDLVHHLDLGDDGVLLVGSRGRGPALRDWLDRYLFSEDVQLSDESGQGTVVEGEVADPPAALSFRREGDRLVVRTFDRRTPWCIVIGAAAATATLASDEAEASRVAHLVPGAVELTDAFTPLDVGLDGAAVHWDKGCYIGQEVIARLDTYAKQHKGLYGLVVDPAGLAVGAPVLLDGVAIGALTSVSPTNNAALPSALAVLKLKDATATVTVGGRPASLVRRARATEAA